MKVTLLLIWSLTLSVPLKAGVLPPDGVVDGKTIGEWAAEFWQWAIPIPTNENPYLALDGSKAHVGQPDGSVFFVAAAFKVSSRVTREFAVPEGKYLFFPLITVYTHNFGPDPRSLPELREEAAGGIDLVNQLHASIDDVQVPNLFGHRAASPAFSLELISPDNLITYNQDVPVTGLIDPIVTDGYWLMVEPLPPGTYRIIFGGGVGPPVNFTRDITNIITVVVIALADRVEELITVVKASSVTASRQQPLLASLNAAKASFDAGHWRGGIGQLHAFRNKLRAQVAPYDPATANELSAAATTIIAKALAQSSRNSSP